MPPLRSQILQMNLTWKLQGVAWKQQYLILKLQQTRVAYQQEQRKAHQTVDQEHQHQMRMG